MSISKKECLTDKRTTIGVKQSTKSRLDKSRAPGQCYDGFVIQMINLWEKHRNNGNQL